LKGRKRLFAALLALCLLCPAAAVCGSAEEPAPAVSISAVPKGAPRVYNRDIDTPADLQSHVTLCLTYGGGEPETLEAWRGGTYNEDDWWILHKLLEDNGSETRVRFYYASRALSRAYLASLEGAPYSAEDFLAALPSCEAALAFTVREPESFTALYEIIIESYDYNGERVTPPKAWRYGPKRTTVFRLANGNYWLTQLNQHEVKEDSYRFERPPDPGYERYRYAAGPDINGAIDLFRENGRPETLPASLNANVEAWYVQDGGALIAVAPIHAAFYPGPEQSDFRGSRAFIPPLAKSFEISQYRPDNPFTIRAVSGANEWLFHGRLQFTEYTPWQQFLQFFRDVRDDPLAIFLLVISAIAAPVILVNLVKEGISAPFVFVYNLLKQLPLLRLFL